MIQDRLIKLCEQFEQESWSLRGITVFRRDRVSDIEAFVYDPVVCLILRGAKVTSIGDQVAELKAGDALLVSHDLPVVSKITRASPAEPYLALILSLDMGIVAGSTNWSATQWRRRRAPGRSPQARPIRPGSIRWNAISR